MDVGVDVKFKISGGLTGFGLDEPDPQLTIISGAKNNIKGFASISVLNLGGCMLIIPFRSKELSFVDWLIIFIFCRNYYQNSDQWYAHQVAKGRKTLGPVCTEVSRNA
jgi:hypothetical protein